MSLLIVIIAAAALILVYSAVKGEDPREVIKRALRKGQ